jgi:predicted regulator of Ras-like GTPase activity (Roadblock/LC7/MglB family)
MNQTAAADLQRWSDEVARNPGAPSFVALADAYRRQGRREAALRVCLRGLDRHPSHLIARTLLSKLYLERGDRDRAVAEWRFVLRLDPDNFEAHRGLGFLALEQGGLAESERHLGRAAALHPGDRTVAGALELVRRRLHGGSTMPAPEAPGRDGRALPVRGRAAPAGRHAPAPTPRDLSGRAPERRSAGPVARPGPQAASTGPQAASTGPRVANAGPRAANVARAVNAPPRVANGAPRALAPAVARSLGAGAIGPARQAANVATPMARAAPATAPAGPPEPGALRDPVRIFESLFAEAPFRGALVLDGQGLVVGGALTTGSAGRAEALGAALGATLEEATRAAARIGLGAWRGLLLETAEATLHLRGLAGGYVLVLLASRSAPTGWVIRTARQAAEIARRFVEGTA